MSKWTTEGSIIRDDDGTQIAEVCCGVIDNTLAMQIIREHNSHAELVICLKEMIKITCGEPTRWPVSMEETEELADRARAAIEAAGRSE